MNRKEFLKTCGIACVGSLSIGLLFQNCMTTRSLNAELKGDQLIVPVSEFKNKEAFYKYLIVRNQDIPFPIYLFRFSETEYSALYLRCTHQGNEVNAYGDKLVCEAHGSEFTNRGDVTSGPASEPLPSFPVKVTNDNLIISIT